MTSYIPAELRRKLIERAHGRCEYCLLPADAVFIPHEVDHIRAEKHGLGSSEDNLAYCCERCNRYKGSDMASIDPETGEAVMLFNPRRDRWRDHFTLDGAEIRGLTAKGRATARLLRFNTLDRIMLREGLIQLGQYIITE